MNLTTAFWEETYNRNIKKMIGLCYRYVYDLQVAEDLAHDSFVSAMKKSDSFKGIGQIDAWLRRITINTALQYLRSSKISSQRQQDLFLTESIESEDTNSPVDFTTQELLDAISLLPEHHRLVFNLYVIDNYSHNDIAKELNISEGTSKSHLARARKKLQSILNEKLKEKDRKKSMVLLFLPFALGKIDVLYRRKFNSYELMPSRTLNFDALDTSDMGKPLIQASFYNSILIYLIVILTVIVGVRFYWVNSDCIREEKPPVVQPDTLTPTTIVDTVLNSNIEKEEHYIEPQNKKVIVRKKRIVRKEVVVLDTIKIVASDGE